MPTTSLLPSSCLISLPILFFKAADTAGYTGSISITSSHCPCLLLLSYISSQRGTGYGSPRRTLRPRDAITTDGKGHRELSASSASSGKLANESCKSSSRRGHCPLHSSSGLASGLRPSLSVSSSGQRARVRCSAEVNPVRSKAGWRALHCAADCGHALVAEVLLTVGAEVDAESNGRRALHLAAKKGHASTVEVLRVAGIHPAECPLTEGSAAAEPQGFGYS